MNTADNLSDDLHYWEHSCSERQVVAMNDYRYINTIQYDPAHKVDASNACIQSSLDLS